MTTSDAVRRSHPTRLCSDVHDGHVRVVVDDRGAMSSGLWHSRSAASRCRAAAVTKLGDVETRLCGQHAVGISRWLISSEKKSTGTPWFEAAFAARPSAKAVFPSTAGPYDDQVGRFAGRQEVVRARP